MKLSLLDRLLILIRPFFPSSSEEQEEILESIDEPLEKEPTPEVLNQTDTPQLTENEKKEQHDLLDQIRKYASWTPKDGNPHLEPLCAEYQEKYPNQLKKMKDAISQGKQRHDISQIKYFASWANNEGQKKVEEIKSLYLKDYPHEVARVEKAIREGKKLNALYDEVFKLVLREGKKTPKLKNMKDQAKNLGGIGRINKQIERAEKIRNKGQEENEKIRKGEKLTTVQTQKKRNGRSKPRTKQTSPQPDKKPELENPLYSERLHPNDLRSLTPSKVWNVVIDETGENFDSEANQLRLNNKSLGRFVAIVIPQRKDVIPELASNWHATDCLGSQIDEVIQNLLDAPVGVFGATVKAIPVTPGSRWLDGVSLLIDWIIRLLPIDNQQDAPTSINVLIENRGEFDTDTPCHLIERECMSRLALAFPGRAARIKLNITIIGKDGSPYNGYADAVANTWARGSKSSKARLEATNFIDTCLLENYSAQDLRRMYDSFSHGIALQERTWWSLISNPMVNNSASLLGAFLRNLGEECQSNTNHWQKYLQETRRQMNISPVNLHQLGAAVDWLQTYQPAESSIPPMMRLTWLTTRLAHSNHLGNTENDWVAELNQLTDRLVLESAPTVCHADLHLAVARTNQYDFEGASASLERWKGKDTVVLGLQMHGRLLSTLGQHAAFQQDHTKAEQLFDEAIRLFQQLSDPFEQATELAQTRCYQAISMMDSGSHSSQLILSSIEKLTGSLPNNIAGLATTPDPKSRYAHHLLLRFLVFCGDKHTDLRKAYLQEQPNWQSGEGHPWPLIQLYRAILLKESGDDQAAVDYAMNASHLAFSDDQGPVVRFIGANCRCIAQAWGCPWPEAKYEIESLKAELPQGLEHIKALEEWIGNPSTPQDLLTSTLPFNFH